MARVAIVTGGSRGIGEAISLELKKAGAKVAANYAGNDERAREFTERTGIPAFKWDVADYASCMEGVRKVEAELGPVDILVNNAGITRDNLLVRMKEDEWDAILSTNLKSVYRLSKAVMRGMMKARSGRIINVLGRLGAVEDVAGAVVFLASDAAAYVTGCTLHVNGGMYMS